MSIPVLPTSPMEEGLETLRWGTRFARKGTEDAYRDWHVEQSTLFNRAGLIASIACWSTILPVLWWIEILASWVPVIPLVVFPPILWALLTTYRRALRRWMIPSTMLANMVAGTVCVGVFSRVGLFETALGGVLIINYFGFAILRARPLQAVFAVAPYIGLQAAVHARAVEAGGMSVASFVLGLVELSFGFFTGLMISVVLDIISRRAYRQQRIIESQQETIAHERARSEALLKSELSHQVAERSRELGDMLVRVGGTAVRALPAPGERFHTRYRVIRSLGEGGMGAVFEVERLTDARRLALKVVTSELSGRAAARFAREAEIGARMQHENLVSIVDVGIAAGGMPFLVMELVQGGSMEEQRKRFGDPRWAASILRQIASGLTELHANGIVHRDLKPGNVLLVDGGPVAKICDFGISRFGALDDSGNVDAEGATIKVPAGDAIPHDLTQTGALMGTPFYMPPEALFEPARRPSADLFSFGILAYEALTGRAPFAVPPVLLVRSGKPIPEPAPLDGVRKEMATLVFACLRADPAERPRAKDIAQALQGEVLP